MKKVVKFGGSSLASAKQFKKVGDIIRADKSRRYVVPSAPGKRNKNDTKVTDMLYACYEAASTGARYGKLLSAIKERYEQIIDGLELNLNLDYEFKTIEENFIAKKGSDYAASRGEYLNGIIMSHYLGYEFIDAAEVIFFDENGTFASENTNETTEQATTPAVKASKPAVPSPASMKPHAPSPAAFAKKAPQHTAPAAASTGFSDADVKTAEAFGRVADDGTVFVKDGEGEREVGQFPDASKEEALALYARRYLDLKAKLDLFANKLKSNNVKSREIDETIKTLSAETEQPAETKEGGEA